MFANMVDLFYMFILILLNVRVVPRSIFKVDSENSLLNKNIVVRFMRHVGFVWRSLPAVMRRRDGGWDEIPISLSVNGSDKYRNKRYSLLQFLRSLTVQK